MKRLVGVVISFYTRKTRFMIYNHVKKWELKRCKTFPLHTNSFDRNSSSFELEFYRTQRSLAEFMVEECGLKWWRDYDLQLHFVVEWLRVGVVKKTEWKSSALLENTLSVPRQPWNCATLDLRSWMSDKHVNCSTFNEFHDLQISHALIANRWSLIENRLTFIFYFLTHRWRIAILRGRNLNALKLYTSLNVSVSVKVYRGHELHFN